MYQREIKNNIFINKNLSRSRVYKQGAKWVDDPGKVYNNISLEVNYFFTHFGSSLETNHDHQLLLPGQFPRRKISRDQGF